MALMTNATLQAMISELGDRIAVIRSDNGEYTLFGYPNTRQKTDDKGKPIFEEKKDSAGNVIGKVPVYEDSLQLTDIQYHDFAGTEFFSVPVKCTNTYPNYTYRVYHLTESIQTMHVMDESSKHLRPDPHGFAI